MLIVRAGNIAISMFIVNEVPHINLLVYGITSKPPAKIY